MEVLGFEEGSPLGIDEGTEVGKEEGKDDGIAEGNDVGAWEGKDVGLVGEFVDGAQVGSLVGKAEAHGFLLGKLVGSEDGCVG